MVQTISNLIPRYAVHKYLIKNMVRLIVHVRGYMDCELCIFFNAANYPVGKQLEKIF